MIARPIIAGLLYQVASRTHVRMVAAKNGADAIAKLITWATQP